MLFAVVAIASRAGSYSYSNEFASTASAQQILDKLLASTCMALHSQGQ